MKTIKTLLKELMRKQSVQNPKDSTQSPNDDKTVKDDLKTEDDKESSLINQNPKNLKDERETDENARDSRMDYPDAGQNSGTDQKQEEETSGDSAPAQSGGRDPESVDEAYQRGLRDGRNAVIEEVYFPKTDDGIPHFHGNRSKAKPGGDIFSMAREA